jgi:hypothetical protein
MGCRNVSSGQIVITEHPVTEGIRGDAATSVKREAHRQSYNSKYQNVPTGSASGARTAKRKAVEQLTSPLPVLRFEMSEASRILRMSRAQLYHRIGEGAIRIQKDGARSYITLSELERYVEACADRVAAG